VAVKRGVVGEGDRAIGGFRPGYWLQAGTGHDLPPIDYDAPNDEAAGLIGGGEGGAPKAWRFTAFEVARAWEAAL
jgi:hypothetical protein